LTNQRKNTTNFARYSGIGLQMLATIGLGTYAGMRLDAWQQNKIPGWTLALSLLSIGASLYNFIRQLPKD
jgi:Putative F0F1-ATPase subunit Ca2+/Mg2+ transporter